MKNTKLFICGGNLLIDTKGLLAVISIYDSVTLCPMPSPRVIPCHPVEPALMSLPLNDPIQGHLVNAPLMSSRNALIRDLVLALSRERRSWIGVRHDGEEERPRKWGLTGS